MNTKEMLAEKLETFKTIENLQTYIKDAITKKGWQLFICEHVNCNIEPFFVSIVIDTKKHKKSYGFYGDSLPEILLYTYTEAIEGEHE